jgi:FkbM family methyltransferase
METPSINSIISLFTADSKKSMETNSINTIFGTFTAESKKRLDLTFDYETCAIRSFKEIAEYLHASCIVDIGANIGVYSIYTHDSTKITEVHAFEPAPDAFKLLETNIKIQANRKKIKTYPLALSSQMGETSFQIISPLSGANKVVEDSADGTCITVKTSRLDDIMSHDGIRVCMKIDVEGHESSVLEGAKLFLRSNHCYLQIEALRKNHLGDIERLLQDLGYIRLFSLQNDHLFIPADWRDEKDALLNIIAKNLAFDLQDLTTLRLEKRTIAVAARKLYRSAGYQKDPVISGDA